MADYPYGYCGMPCALCSRYRTNAKSRCHGCSCGGYYTEPCKVHHCCRREKHLSISVNAVGFHARAWVRWAISAIWTRIMSNSEPALTLHQRALRLGMKNMPNEPICLLVLWKNTITDAWNGFLCELFIQQKCRPRAELGRLGNTFFVVCWIATF